MSLTPEQIAAANKANLESLLGLTQKSFEGVEKLVELNVQTARTALDESAEYVRAVLAAKDVQEVLGMQAGLLQPASEKVLAYGRKVYDIATATQAELTKMAEAQAGEAQSKLQGLFEAAAKNAPAGSESAVAMMKSAMEAANTAIESVQKAAKQAASATEANLENLSKTAAKAAAEVAPKAASRRATAA
ncbi:MAG: hypothetical protein RLY71_3341 [Pseudomonadota bacterium]|jgi:phasin family protein